MMNEPLLGKRQVIVTERHPPVDFAKRIRDLLEVRYLHTEKVVLVMDHLNTHNKIVKRNEKILK